MSIISIDSSNKSSFAVFINKHSFKIAFGIFVSYLGLSLYKIGDNSLWFDEAYSVDLAISSIDKIIKTAITEDVNPPLYLVILHYWLDLFGESEMALRSLSAVAMSLACGILFLFCRRFFNWQTAIFSVLLFFVSNELYYYSEEGRTYGLVILFCVLSNYAYMSFVKEPNWKNALLLGIFNSVIFYLHTLACLSFIGQIILIPFLTFNITLFNKKDPSVFSFLGYKLKHLFYYIFSWLVFGILFIPWREPFFDLMSQKSKSFWLNTPTSTDLQKCLYEFSNSKELFFIYAISFTLIVIAIICVKKLRDTDFSYKLLLIPIIMGPFLMLLNYELSVYLTPIFLKRYILFVLLGFIIAYAYAFSILKIDFRIKFGVFAILLFFSAKKMVVPRDSWYDFKEGVERLKKVMGPKCYISTDMPTLFAYYYDREKLFLGAKDQDRYNLLAQFGIFYQNNITWQNSIDVKKYRDIYYTRTFDDYYDPEHIVIKELNSKYIFQGESILKGLRISHYSVPVSNKDSVLFSIKESIKNDKSWMEQIKIKASQRKISIDSMIVLDAIWQFKQTNN